MARAKEAQTDALGSGLLNSGKEHTLFRSLGIGEARATSFLPGRGSEAKTKLREQWWAPAYLVELNAYMKKLGFSSKLRGRALVYVVEGRDLPDRLADAVAGYTESKLLRQLPRKF